MGRLGFQVRPDKVKGKTIFTGPPAGSASATSEALIKIITGYEAGKDYTAVRLSWACRLRSIQTSRLPRLIRGLPCIAVSIV